MPDKEVVAFGPFKSFIADGVRVGDTIHLSGAVSVDTQGNALHEGDVVAQLRQAYANLAGPRRMGALRRSRNASSASTVS